MTEKYAESGVVEVANDKGKFQSIKFRGRSEWFSNWGAPLDVGAIINFNFTEKGQFRNISNFELVNKPKEKEEPETKQAPVRNPEPDYHSADTINEKETDSIKSRIKEITISRGQTKQFSQYEPTNFHVSAKAEYNPSDDPEEVCAVLTEIVETELNREIINETEKRKENGN